MISEDCLCNPCECQQRIAALIFDFGGVLLMTRDSSGRSSWESTLGLPLGALSSMVLESKYALRAELGQVSETEVWEHLAGVFGLSSGQLLKLRQAFWEDAELNERLVRLIRRLRPSYKIAILSNAWSDAREVFTRKYDLGSIVDLIMISAELGIAKPDVRIFEIAAERLGVCPREVLFIDDKLENIRGARAAGMHGLHFQATEQAIADLARYLRLS